MIDRVDEFDAHACAAAARIASELEAFAIAHFGLVPTLSCTAGYILRDGRIVRYPDWEDSKILLGISAIAGCRANPLPPRAAITVFLHEARAILYDRSAGKLTVHCRESLTDLQIETIAANCDGETLMLCRAERPEAASEHILCLRAARPCTAMVELHRVNEKLRTKESNQ